MFITEYDVQKVFRSALERVSKCLNISDIDWKGNHELYDEIKSSGSDIIKFLDNFFLSYSKWYQYHYDRKDKPVFDVNEKQDLNKLITMRDTSRQDLINLLGDRGC